MIIPPPIHIATPTSIGHTHLDPLDPLSRVLLLLLFEDQLYEELLQLLIAVVDTHLLKTEREQYSGLQQSIDR